MATLNQLYEAKLASSGLTLADGKALRFEPLAAAAVPRLSQSFKPYPAIKLPYFGPDLKPLEARPRWGQFYRIRYLDIPAGFDGKPSIHKYDQPPESGLCAYFPPNGKWPLWVKDHAIPLIITEGELKAAKSVKDGFAAIGLGGVWSFKSSRNGLQFLPELEQVNWVKRVVHIAFDSDFRTNPNVCKALHALAIELYQRGALPHILPLPSLGATEHAKTGLDDFLVAKSPDALDDLISRESKPLTLGCSLWKLNDEVVYVKDPGFVVKLDTFQKLAPEKFTGHAYSHVAYAEQTLKDDGTLSLKTVQAAPQWLKWPLRHEAGKIVYAPGQPRFTKDYDLNTWAGWGVEPKAGDVKPFVKLLSHLFQGSEPEALPWFLKWCAYPFQYPGTKMFSSVVLQGRIHGTGKSLVGYSLGKIYGKNFTEINQGDLHNNFNEWAENKQFVLGDDVTGSDKRADADMLKKLITQEQIRLNPKHLSTYVIRDCINYLWTTNQPDAFFLEDTDRRFFIHEVTVPPLPEEWYVDYKLWLDTTGASAIFHYLKNLPLAGFNPAGPALRTKAKERMTEDVRSDLGSWVRRLLTTPDEVLRVGSVPLDCDLYTNKQLLNLYDPEGRTRTTGNGLGRELKRAGARQVLEGAVVKGPDGQDRFYIVRSQERWLRATISDVKRHLAGEDKPAAPPAKTKAPKFRR